MDWLRELHIFFYRLRKSSLKVFQKNASLKISKISKENFRIGLHIYCKLACKAYNFTKTVLKDGFSWDIFSEFLKKLLYFQISSPITEAYFKPNKKSMWELFGENSYAKKFYRRYFTGF